MYIHTYIHLTKTTHLIIGRGCRLDDCPLVYSPVQGDRSEVLGVAFATPANGK